MTQTKSDYIDFDKAVRKGQALLKDKKKKVLGLYIIVAITTGLRVSDLKNITFEHLRKDVFIVKETKTGKFRTISVNDLVKDAIKVFKEDKDAMLCFRSQKKQVYSSQGLNRLLKDIFKIEMNQGKNISTHSLRKTFGRAVYDQNGQSEHALIKLSEIFSHSTMKITRIYLGITDQEIQDIYLGLK